MSEQLQSIQLSVGDVILGHTDDIPAVVVEISTSIQAAHILPDKQGDWRLGLPGTLAGPVDKIASLSLESTAMGLCVTLDRPTSKSNYASILKMLLKESKSPPVAVPAIKQDQALIY